jgi:hypothetical protein
VAVKAAGNANDHRRTTAQRPLVEAIAAGEVRRIDLLCLTIGIGLDARTQYAHSYIGMGPDRSRLAPTPSRSLLPSPAAVGPNDAVPAATI